MDEPLPPPGWYADPTEPGSRRWFDGSVWTTDVWSDEVASPDRPTAPVPGQGDDGVDRTRGFSDTGRSVPRGGERPYDGGAGQPGLPANRVGRSILRTGARWGPVRAVRWAATLTVLLAVCAWGDPAHRPILLPLAVVGLVVTVVVGVREARERAHWDEVGREE